MRSILGVLAVWLLAVWLLAGCGGVEEDVALEAVPERGAEVTQAGGGDCIYEFRIVYYSDATYSTPVGGLRCQCLGSPYFHGTRTEYSVTLYEWQCPPPDDGPNW